MEVVFCGVAGEEEKMERGFRVEIIDDDEVRGVIDDAGRGIRRRILNVGQEALFAVVGVAGIGGCF